jgi:hypothetical protein
MEHAHCPSLWNMHTAPAYLICTLASPWDVHNVPGSQSMGLTHCLSLWDSTTASAFWTRTAHCSSLRYGTRTLLSLMRLAYASAYGTSTPSQPMGLAHAPAYGARTFPQPTGIAHCPSLWDSHTDPFNETNYYSSRARIFKRLWSPGIDSKE